MANRKQKWVIFTITLFLIWWLLYSFYNYQNNIRLIDSFKQNQLALKKKDIEKPVIQKLTKEEFQNKVDEKQYLEVISALNAVWIKNVKLLKNDIIKKKLLDWKIEVEDTKELEKKDLEDFMVNKLKIDKNIFDKVIKNKEKSFPLFNIKKDFEKFFIKNVLEDNKYYYLITLENIKNEKGRINSYQLKIKINNWIYNILEEILKYTKDEEVRDNIEFILNNKNELNSKIKLINIYIINKKDINKFNKEEYNQNLYKNIIHNYFNDFYEILNKIIIPQKVKIEEKQEEIKEEKIDNKKEDIIEKSTNDWNKIKIEKSTN